MNLLLLLLLTLTTVSFATRTFVDCSCSPSKRGYTRSAKDELNESLVNLRERETSLKEEQANDATLTDIIIANKLTAEAVAKWNGCVQNVSYEECVNADAGMRYKDGEYESSFCKFDRTTWRNGDKPSCDTITVLASTDTTIVSGSPEVASATPPPGGVAASKNDATAVRTPAPGSANAALPIPEKQPAPSGLTSVNDHEPAVEINDPSLSAKETPVAKKVNEGCVAVEHLVGYKLQHTTHLRRNVLCASNFCATPNHAIIVDGVWTSMKKLCSSQWDCVRSVKLVNNLLVTANRRVMVNKRIVVTPYDIRFPRCAVWVIQIVEQFITLLSSSVIASFVAVGVTVIAFKFRC